LRTVLGALCDNPFAQACRGGPPPWLKGHAVEEKWAYL